MTAVDPARDLEEAVEALFETVMKMREAHSGALSRHLPHGAAPNEGLAEMHTGIIVALEILLDSEAAIRVRRLLEKLEAR